MGKDASNVAVSSKLLSVVVEFYDTETLVLSSLQHCTQTALGFAS